MVARRGAAPVAAIGFVSGDSLDFPYLERTAAEVGVADELREARSRAGTLKAPDS